jgi:hypothetical protein
VVYLNKRMKDYGKVLVFWKENLALLAVPKTGTTAIEKALSPHASMVILDPPMLKHIPLYRYDRFLKPFFLKTGDREMETTAVIRNPIDWLGSWYKYRSRPTLDGKPNSTADVTFDDFVLEAIKGDSAPFADVGSQLRFLTNRDDSVGGTHMFKYENLGRYVDFLQSRLNRKIELELVNVSPATTLDLSKKTEEKLRRKWDAEFELWNSVD